MRHLTAVILLCIVSVVSARGVFDTVSGRGTILPGYNEDSVVERLSERPLHPIEGIWEVAGEGSLMAIEKVDERPTLYAMVLIQGYDLGLRRGTVMGWLTPGAAEGKYDARIFSSRIDDGTLLVHPDRYEASIDKDEVRITIKPYGRSFRINWWRLLLPYMFRSAITPIERHSSGLEGFTRVWPEPIPPLTPRYL